MEVPFGPRKLIGMVCGEPSETPSGDVAVSKLKPIHSVLDAEPLLPQTYSLCLAGLQIIISTSGGVYANPPA